MISLTKKIIFLYVVTYTILFVLFYFDVITVNFLISSIYAGLINLINSYTAIRLFELSIKKEGSSFIFYNIGGLGIRLIIILIIFVLVIKFLNIDKYGFILTFFILYFVLLFLEVIFYHKTVKNFK